MPNYRLKTQFYLGLLSGLVTVTLSYILRVTINTPFLPELAAAAIISITPASIESQIILLLREAAKYITILSASIINVLLYGLLTVLIFSLSEDRRVRAGVAVGLAALINMGLAFSFIMLSEVEPVRITLSSLLLGILLPSFSYGMLLSLPPTLLYGETKTRRVCNALSTSKSFKNRRRLFIHTLSASALAFVIIIYGLEKILNNRTQLENNVETTQYQETVDVLNHPITRSVAEYEVTPNELFYRVDINTITTPNIDVSRWRLRISGSVYNELYLTYDEITSLPYVEEYTTLECVSNEIGGDLMSTAKWRGVKLKDILQRAGVKQGAKYVVFKCYDGYDVGIPLEKALEENVILAYMMNDRQLPKDHGFPLRAVVPSYYGMMNAKWITGIEVVDETYNGFWQRRGWANEAEYKIHSTILTHGNPKLRRRFPSLAKHPTYAILNRRTIVAGIAFAGDRGIERVEVSVDGGRTWENATLKDPLSGSTWVIWALEWLPTRSGGTKIMVRAVDKTGKVQTAVVKPPFPDGATGYHVIDIEVKPSAP